MKVIYTDQSLVSLREVIDFLLKDLGIPIEKVSEIKTQLLDKADSLALNPYKGQKEEYLEHLGYEHRRLIEGHFKIIYIIEKDTIFITDFFDARQDPEQMKG
ncbi:MAG: type II toxin-antitoxin system RelE/ParE family toxin [Cyclobacteriaceae bacterium]|nr:type II toxin-antitoxin system RelE/ParE family toxin [Cyclobacteriaceae bacterium]